MLRWLGKMLLFRILPRKLLPGPLARFLASALPVAAWVTVGYVAVAAGTMLAAGAHADVQRRLGFVERIRKAVPAEGFARIDADTTASPGSWTRGSTSRGSRTSSTSQTPRDTPPFGDRDSRRLKPTRTWSWVFSASDRPSSS